MRLCILRMDNLLYGIIYSSFHSRDGDSLMVFRKSNQDDNDTENWNVAKSYALTKVMRWLALLDEYETVARFGTIELAQEFEISEDIRTRARLKALSRLAHGIERLIRNTIFAMKDPKDLELLTSYKDIVIQINSALPMAQSRAVDQRNNMNSITINEDMFNKLLSALVHISEQINRPLNRAGLIFRVFEDFDPDKMKEELMEDFINVP